MGGGHQQHLLCTLPWPEPHEILDEIRQKHPRLKVTYYQLTKETAQPFDSYGLEDGWFSLESLGLL